MRDDRSFGKTAIGRRGGVVLATLAVVGLLVTVVGVMPAAADVARDNDDIGAATVVTGPFPFTATQDNLAATQNPADPTPSCGAPNNFTVWYSYTPATD